MDPEPDPHQFADDKPKCMEYETISALFQWFEPFYLEAKIWIRIRIKVMRIQNTAVCMCSEVTVLQVYEQHNRIFNRPAAIGTIL